jgi:hypothetical protein
MPVSQVIPFGLVDFTTAESQLTVQFALGSGSHVWLVPHWKQDAQALHCAPALPHA